MKTVPPSLPPSLSYRAPSAGPRGTCIGPARGAAGFTIIELMIVMVILGALITIAAPSLRTMIVGNAVRSVTGDLLSDIAMSRSEASKRSQRVVLCASTNQNTCTGASSWALGWISFVDADNNGQRDTVGANEPLLRVKEAAPTSVQVNTSPAGVSNIRFRSIGVIDAAKTITLCPAQTGSGANGRTITVNALGRVQTVTVTCP